ncbi:MAG TPA: hypothetical protein VME46_12085 [Acidimicrobiales bacterium]|nr:hypothetical protein [Acidimicrobiales bacterium]
MGVGWRVAQFVAARWLFSLSLRGLDAQRRQEQPVNVSGRHLVRADSKDYGVVKTRPGSQQTVIAVKVTGADMVEASTCQAVAGDGAPMPHQFRNSNAGR